MFSFTRNSVYWISQVGGWGSYILLAGILSVFSGTELDKSLSISLITVFSFGVALSHLYRTVIKGSTWKTDGIISLIPKILFGAVLLALALQVMYTLVDIFVLNNPFEIDLLIIFQRTIGWGMLFLFWSLIYFSFHFFENYRKEEIKNLRWEATKNEIELNKLKSQLNPHFIFNSMNSIRALIEEDPQKAKLNITRLSNILRNTLLMGKKKMIPFVEEMALVKDYLELETTRFEERLRVNITLDPKSKRFQVPPMMLQTLVENGIKHGTSKLIEGGELQITTVINEEENLIITITNSGQLTEEETATGFGIKNTEQRLLLLYGQKAKFHIFNSCENEVTTQITIPKDPVL